MSSSNLYPLEDFVRGEVDVLEGRTGLLNLVVKRRALGRLSNGQVRLLPRRRRAPRVASEGQAVLPFAPRPAACRTS